jgi:GntR family transcriptional regulator, transcriptional repressor for pyruvate dehydrogenase complex
VRSGERLGTKDDLRKRFRVAVATVNEATRPLETRGLIEARPGPGGGAFVARPAARIAMSHVVLGFATGSTSYAECLELQDALEPLIDSHAVELSNFDGAATVAVHRDLVEAIDAGEGPEFDAASAADADGHERMERVIGSHLERFGRRDGLSVAWQE